MAILTIRNSSCLIPLICVEYGYLYNWYAANGDTDGNGVSNTSISSSDTWTIPSTTQVSNLYNYIGGQSVAGGKLKDTVSWDPPNTGATNMFGFSVKGTGSRSDNGNFVGLGLDAHIWTRTSRGPTTHYTIGEFKNTSGELSIAAYMTNGAGVGVRFVHDATGITDGTTTTYTGNDGKVYNAIAINGLYWLSENLAETKYRNGDIIPEVTDNTEWSNLVTGALCCYNNG